MYRSHLSRLSALALAAALCLSMTGCKSKQNPEQSSSSPAQSGPAISQSQTVGTPLEEIMAVLAQKGLEEYESVSDQVELDNLFTHTVGDQSLVIVRQTGLPHAGGTSNLLMGVWDEQSKDIIGDVITLRGDDGLRSSWEDQDGLFHVLLTNSGISQGWEGGCQVLYFTFDGTTLTQITEMPGQYLYEGDPLPDGWQDVILSGDSEFWQDLKAVPYPGGMELYARNPEFDNTAEDGQAPQWIYLGYLALDGVPLPIK